jgi:cobalt/nickel transport protein
MMSKWFVVAIALLVAAVALGSTALAADEKWPGVDEAVVKKFAEQAGRPAWEPFINVEGDVLLFCFLVAGTVGGFVAGYYYRELFPSRGKRLAEQTDV